MCIHIKLKNIQAYNIGIYFRLPIIKKIFYNFKYTTLVEITGI